MTIGLFEAIETIEQALSTNLTKLFDQYGTKKNKITYVKDEKSNLITMWSFKFSKHLFWPCFF